MIDNFFTLKEVRLNNHCPECYSREGLMLTSKQRFTENALYKAITNVTSHSLHCSTCNTEIFPARWTEDIEQVVDYHIRATDPKPKALKLKKMAWAFIAIGILIVVGIVLFTTGVLN